jgi:hypothetical protein
MRESGVSCRIPDSIPPMGWNQSLELGDKLAVITWTSLCDLEK